MKNTTKRFRAQLQRDTHNLGWLTVRIPFDPAKAWPERNRLRVRGQIGPLTFRSSLFPLKDGGYFLLINKKMQAAAHVTEGDTAEILLEPDLEERTITPPPELDHLLKQDRSLRKWFLALPASNQRDCVTRIQAAKTQATRTKRAEQFVERMLLTIEGEQTPPPILRTLFRAHPGTESAWHALTPTQRRGHLMGIYYYQTPDARERRAQKAIEELLTLLNRERR